MALDMDKIRPIIQRALDEDIGPGDITTESIVTDTRQARADIVAQEPGVVAGIPVAISVFQILDVHMIPQTSVQDGQRITAGDTVLSLFGSLQAILSGERVALNFLQRLSGVATQTAHFVKAVSGTGVRILDTRKTTPNLRYLEKYAVAMGGGHNHRMGLYDMILIKDNHIKAAGGISEAIRKVRVGHPGLPIEVEVTNLKQVIQAVEEGADRIMLDNMNSHRINEAINWVRCHIGNGRRPDIEVSGNITLENIQQMAMVGVDDVSTGSITHSVMALDMSLKITQLNSSSGEGL